jgi:hypothetical protein
MPLFGGLFLVAVGEWRYYTGKEISFHRTPAGIAKVTDVPRKIHNDGVLFQAAGLAAIVYAIYPICTAGSF